MGHYEGLHDDVASTFIGIVTDVQVRATTRAFAQALVDGGVPEKDVLRYRISLPIKAEDEHLPPAHKEKFKGKVPHAFDFLHWWFVLHLWRRLMGGIANELGLRRRRIKRFGNGLVHLRRL